MMRILAQRSGALLLALASCLPLAAAGEPPDRRDLGPAPSRQVGELANRPEGGLTIGKFDLLATYTYARSLRDGFPEPEARVRGITAAVMGARARGLKRGGAGAPADPGAAEPGPEPVTPRKKAKTLTAKSFDQQVAEKYGPWFAGTFLPTMKQLVAARLSYAGPQDPARDAAGSRLQDQLEAVRGTSQNLPQIDS